MQTILQDAADLLVSSPGNLVYHLVLAFSIAGALQIAFQHWRREDTQVWRRMLIGLGVLFVLRLAFFAVSGIAWGSLLSAHQVLPPIDRTINALSLSLIIWLLVAPEPSRMADLGNVVFILLGGLVGAVSLVTWASQSAGADFNSSNANTVWSLFSLTLSLLGIFLLYRLKPVGRGFGLAVLTLLFFGEAGHLALDAGQGDYAGYVRLAQLAAYPLLLALPSRVPTFSVRDYTLEELVQQNIEEDEEEGEPTAPRKVADPQTILSLLSLASETDPDEIAKTLTWAVSHSMLADVALLVGTIEEEGFFNIRCGYDLIHDEPLGGGTFDAALLPRLYAALKKGRSIRYLPPGDSADAAGFKELLGIEPPGTVMAVPIASVGSEPVGAIVLLTPYSSYEWTKQDQLTLESFSPVLAEILGKGEREAYLHEQIALGNEKYEAAAARLEAIERERESEAQEAENSGRQAALEAATAQLEELQNENEALKESLASLQAVAAAELESTELEEKLAEALERVAQLQNELAQAQVHISDLEMQAKAPPPEKVAEFLTPPVDLGAVIDETVELTSHQLREKQITLRVDIPEDIPMVEVERDSLRQIVFHLLQNAGAATPLEGEISLHAALQDGHTQGGEFVLVQVTDSGEGIPPEEIAEVFSHHYRPTGMHLHGLGETGLGLSVVKALTEAAGGRVWIDSEIGRGSTFSVLLPAGPPPAREEAGPVEAGGAQA